MGEVRDEQKFLPLTSCFASEMDVRHKQALKAVCFLLSSDMMPICAHTYIFIHTIYSATFEHFKFKAKKNVILNNWWLLLIVVACHKELIE